MGLFKQTKMGTSGNSDVNKAEPQLKEDSTTSLEAQLNEAKVELTRLQEVLDSTKTKNNELREKNWKAMDAVSTAETNFQAKLKQVELAVFKNFKEMNPNLAIPSELDFEATLAKYKENWLSYQEANKQEIITKNEELTFELANLRSKLEESCSNDSEAAQQEIAHYKKVLADTEEMLSQLQEGVDLEMNKKTNELTLQNSKIKELEETMTKLVETNAKQEEMLKNIQAASADGRSKAGELDLKEKKITELEELLEILKVTCSDQAQQLAKKSEEAKEVDDLKAKLKKTTSERDLLIREYKNTKDSKEKLDMELKRHCTEHEAEMQKMQETLASYEQSSGKGDKEKDKLIAQLRLQVEELQEDLREERDHVVVDIDTHCVEELESKVEEITKELDSEKESKLQLSTKLGDLESSYQEAQSDKERVLNLESKLNAAEARLREFEAAQESPDFNDTTTKM